MKSLCTFDNPGFLLLNRFRILLRKTAVLGGVLCVTGITTGVSEEEISAPPHVIPKPKIERYEARSIPLTQPGGVIFTRVSSSSEKSEKSVQEGLLLLSDRLGFLGATDSSLQTASGNHQILIEKCSADELSTILRNEGVKESIAGKRLAQAYYLRAHQQRGQGGEVTIRACTDLGLYYGLLSLCQLVDNDDFGQIVVPAVTLVDWPEIGFRLSKTSASDNQLHMLRRFSDWMKVFKINMVGLQYHGGNSKAPEEPFPSNIQALCNEHRDDGILETMVYFCPFRGGGENITGVDFKSFQKQGAYDLAQRSEREHYATFLKWIMDQGAHGIEIDYNDWPGKASNMENVIKFVCDELQEAYPEARILFCPPFFPPEERDGEVTYWGNASPETKALLAKVPEKVWPLWTGPGGITIVQLKDSEAEKWAEDAGRKPFFWLNRVGAEVNKSFSRPLEEIPGLNVFHGELLPKDLNRLFEGIHFNAALGPGYNNLGENFSTAALVYFASAADYVWNPHDWDAVESTKRAQRFVSIMQPLMAKRILTE